MSDLLSTTLQGTQRCQQDRTDHVPGQLDHHGRGVLPGQPRFPQLTELVGRVSLKELVRESTDLVEKLCIEAALELTRDNRASAAEMLGLSRQSLYVKLRRFNIGDLTAAPADE